jgi:hypothetical protein
MIVYQRGVAWIIVHGIEWQPEQFSPTLAEGAIIRLIGGGIIGAICGLAQAKAQGNGRLAFLGALILSFLLTAGCSLPVQIYRE